MSSEIDELGEKTIAVLGSYPFKLVVFDLDGTLATTRSGAEFPQTVYDRKALPDAEDTCLNLAGLGVKLAVATNQGGVAFGYHHKDELETAIRMFCLDRFGIEDVFLCYQHPKATVEWWRGDSERRKPGPGMLLEAMESAEVTAAETLFVGDMETDRQAAEAAGCAFAWAHEFITALEEEEAEAPE